jgi:hypothetical protein
MTQQTMDHPRTVGGVLFDDDDPASSRALERSLDRAGIYGAACQAVGVLSTVGRDEIRSRLTETAKDLLGTQVVDTVFAGWRKKDELVGAAEATAGNPDKSVLVDLCSQRIEARHECTLDIVVDGWTVASFRFIVTLVLDIDAMLAIVQGGRLVGLRGGNCAIQAGLAVNGQQVAEHQRRIELDKVISLGAGIPLCRAASLRADLPSPAGN